VRFVRTGAVSQFTKRASAPGPRPNIAAAAEIARAGYRLPRPETMLERDRRCANISSAKPRAGRLRRLMAPEACAVHCCGQRACAHRDLTRGICLRFYIFLGSVEFHVGCPA
jgi:hypothetical protein